MGVGSIKISDLDDFVEECDRLGGVQSIKAEPFISDFSLQLSIYVDEALDPFSPEYTNMQISVYKEISGRELNQVVGEQDVRVDVEKNIKTANPYGIKDTNFIAKHARAVLTSLLVSQLPANAKILDMGAGWGLSTEMLAFAGAEVHAVDINPLFVELIRNRVKPRCYDVKAFEGEFDLFKSSSLYDLILFYESLHHAIKPWETIRHLSRYLKPDGKITIAGEPINHIWWKNWGIRLDALSVYCIRKFGWFESGWSEKFISECFDREGFTLTLLPFIGLDNGHVGVAIRRENKTKISADAVMPSVLTNNFEILQNERNQLAARLHLIESSRIYKIANRFRNTRLVQIIRKLI